MHTASEYHPKCQSPGKRQATPGLCLGYTPGTGRLLEGQGGSRTGCPPDSCPVAPGWQRVTEGVLRGRCRGLLPRMLLDTAAQGQPGLPRGAASVGPLVLEAAGGRELVCSSCASPRAQSSAGRCRSLVLLFAHSRSEEGLVAAVRCAGLFPESVQEGERRVHGLLSGDQGTLSAALLPLLSLRLF